MEADFDTTVDKAGEGSQKPTSQATIVKTLTQLNHLATDTVRAYRVNSQVKECFKKLQPVIGHLQVLNVILASAPFVLNIFLELCYTCKFFYLYCFNSGIC